MYDEWVKTEYTRGYGLVGHPAMIIGEGEGTVRRAGHSTASNCAMAAKTSIGNAPRLVPPNTLPHTHAHARTQMLEMSRGLDNVRIWSRWCGMLDVGGGCRWWMRGGGRVPSFGRREARGQWTDSDCCRGWSESPERPVYDNVSRDATRRPPAAQCTCTTVWEARELYILALLLYMGQRGRGPRSGIPKVKAVYVGRGVTGRGF